MKYIPLAMIRPTMTDIPVVDCPQGYAIRSYRDGDEHNWARIEVAVGDFADTESALRCFHEFYGSDINEQADRCFFLVDAQDEAIGTASAWPGEFGGEPQGRLSWVAITPEYQGKHLAKPLLSTVMARLAKEYSKAYLATQTTSYRAINLYLAFGFVPYPMRETCDEGWALVEEALGREIIQRDTIG